MISVQASILIERPVEAVFAFVARDFFENYPRWSPELECLEVLEPGPIRLGSAARQVRVDRGRRTDTTFKVVEWEPLRQVAFEELDQRYHLRYSFEPVGEAVVEASDAERAPPHTRLIFACRLKRLSLALRPFKSMIRNAVQEGAEQTVVAIKGLVE